jgi:non-canonical purine NTP pyrophosphatase (RdgB/HAM1 family)
VANNPCEKLLVATTNADKLREIRGVLSDIPCTLVTLQDLAPVPEPEETGLTFGENARLKATYYASRLVDPLGDAERARVLTVAEDSGIAVDALHGEPGVRSARFVRPDATYPERMEELNRRLAAKADRPRTARYICAVTVVRDGKVVYETTGAVEGEIAKEPRGTGGFGYDPIFYYPPYKKTLGEVSQEDKRLVSHRGHAFRRLAEWLRWLHAKESKEHRGE